MTDFDFRFGGIGRLYGTKALQRFREAHVCVVGVGGVGSWTVEALARSGVGKLTLIDLDDICVSNVNRQLHALDGAVGRQKVEALAERIKLINPECDVVTESEFFTAKTRDALLEPGFDCVVDAIDQPVNKCLLIEGCRDRGIPVVTVGGAGGKRDPTKIVTDDLTRATHDSLLKRVRKMLRQDFSFPRGEKRWDVPCVYSPEGTVFPGDDGEVCESPANDTSLRLDCASGFGAATFVTGTFGFVAAGVALGLLINSQSKVHKG